MAWHSFCSTINWGVLENSKLGLFYFHKSTSFPEASTAHTESLATVIARMGCLGLPVRTATTFFFWHAFQIRTFTGARWRTQNMNATVGVTPQNFGFQGL